MTRHQIILLALLVSFMTSIVTGIVTVSLMGQAPTSVTRTINQIVERTVQTVVPAQSAAVVTTTKNVVVNNDDLVAKSIAQVQKGIIRITARGGKDLLARGIIVDAKGTALTDAVALASSGAEAFDAILSDGTRVPLTIRQNSGTSTSIATVDVAVGTSTGFAPVAITNPAKLQLGQSVIRIGGSGVDSVAEGVVATLPNTTDTAATIETSVSSATPGAVLCTLFGEVIGIATDDSLSQGSDFYTIATPPPPAAPKAPATTPKP